MSEWKNKLEELDQLPAAPLDKSAAWDKLYPRLQGKTARKRPVYWIAAAACLVCVTSVVLWINNRSTETATPPAISKKENQQLIAPVKSDETIKKSLVTPPVEIELPIVAERKHNQTRKDELFTANKKDSVLMPVPEQITPEEIAVNTPDNNNNTPSPAVQPKKKMRVVHINEIGNAREEVIMAQRVPTGKVYFQLNNSNPSLSLPPSNINSRVIFNPTN